MSFTDEYLAHKKKKKKEDKTTEKQIAPLYTNKTAAFFGTDIRDIAPVVAAKHTKEDEDDRKWYQKGEFEDGYQWGDVTRTLLGTGGDNASLLDLTWNSAKRGYYNSRLGEESFAAMNNQANEKDVIEQILSGDDYQFTPGTKLASGISGAFELLGQQARQFTNPRTLAVTGSAAGAAFVAGQVGPQVLVPEEVVSVPVAAIAGFKAGSAASALEIEAGLAYNEMVEAGISEKTAKKVALGVGTLNAGLDVFQTDELLDAYKIVGKSGATETFTKRIIKELAERGIDVATETAQEVAQEGVTIAGTQFASKAEKGEWAYSADEVGGRLLETAGSSALSFGLMNVPAATKNMIFNGKGQKTNVLTEDERKVVDKEVEKRVSELEKKGERVSVSEKTAIEAQVEKDLERGYISTDTIEEVLGGESYTAYDSLVKESEEFNELYEKPTGELSRKQLDRLAELEAKNNENPYKTSLETAKEKMSNDVSELVKGSRLFESYNEKERAKQDFQADYDKYKGTKHEEAARKTLDSAIKAGVNNTSRVHDIVDLAAKISSETGLTFTFKSGKQITADFIENQTNKIAELENITERTPEQDELLGKLKDTLAKVQSGDITVNGDIVGGDVVLNLDSKKPLNRVVGHEVTHSLGEVEQTKEYVALKNAVFNYAKTNGVDIDSRLNDLKLKYEGITNANPEAELVADLVGDYLFTDKEFVNRLSVEHRNVFQKIYDQIKYLCKIATAGSQEARELERVKKAFEDAYRTSGKTDGDTKYSLTADQKQTSEDTSLNQTPAAFTYFKFKPTDRILDYGGGRYDTAKKTMESVYPGIQFEVMDKFNRTDTHNGRISSEFTQNKANVVTINNVLNVIDGEQARDEVISESKALLAPDGVAYFTIYDGDGSGVGRVTKSKDDPTKSSWQNNQPASFYVSEIKKHYKNAEIVGGKFIVASDGEITFSRANPEIKQAVQNATKQFKGEKLDMKDSRYSLSDNTGKKLTKEQQDYFKDSKMRDDNGNLMVMYHGSQDAGFHTFDAKMSDDDTSFFFVDRNDVAASYSGTSETYEAKTIRTAEDMNNFLAEIGYDQYTAVEKDGKFELLENNEHVAWSDTAQGIYEEFCWYEGVGEGDANYKVYLNLKNPLIVDAKGRNWNNVSREYSQEVADKYHSLTAEEKAALTSLTEWEDFSTFRYELMQAFDNNDAFEKESYDAFASNVRSAYEKLGGENANLYDVFTIATDNFSEDSIKEFAVKQMNTRDYSQKAKAEGYDGVIFKNIHDNGGYSNGSEGTSTVAIAFDSNQIKSVANEKPTSDPDIRYSLSMDSEGRKLSENQAVYFKDSKAIDENGNLKVVYHGSPADFNTFSLKHIGTNGTAEGYGFYFTDKKSIAENYTRGREGQQTGEAGKLFEVYLDIKKPLSDTEVTMTRSQFRKFLTALNEQVDSDGEPLDVLSNYGDVAWEGLNKVLNYAMEIEYDGSDNDVNLVSSIINGTGNMETVLDVLRKTTGYDGIIVNEATWGGDQTIYLTFHPEQIKNVDNLNPTSDPDIRKSISSAGEKVATIGNFDVYGKDMKKVAPVAEETAKTEQNVPKTENVPVVSADETTTEKTTPTVLYNKRDGKNGWGDVYSTAQEALNDAVRNVDSELWKAFNDEVDNTPQNTKLPRGSMPITDALIAVQEDVRQEAITPIQGAKLLSEAYNHGGADTLKRLYNPNTGNLYNQYLERAKQYDSVAPVAEIAEMFPDDLAPIQQELDNRLQGKEALENRMLKMSETGDFSDMPTVNERYKYVVDRINELEAELGENESGRLNSLDDSNVPPETELYPGEPTQTPDPFADRDMGEVGNRKVKAYMYENPEVKPFFQAEARAMLGDLHNGTKGEKWYNDEVYYATGGEKGWGGTKRHTTEHIAELLDIWHYTYDQIENGLNAIIEDNGKENNAVSKRIEFMLDDRLRNGYTDVFGEPIPADQEYINLLKEKQITEYSKENLDSLLKTADRYAPVAPVAEVKPVSPKAPVAPVKEKYEAIKPKPSKEPKMARATPAEQARAEILTEEPKVKKDKAGVRSKINNLVLDKGMIFEDLSLATGNRELQARWNSIRYAEGKAQKLIGEGNSFVDSLKSMQEQVESTGKTKQFYEYLYHMHNVDRMTLEERFKDTPNKAVFGDDVTADVSRAAAAELESSNPEFKQWAKDVYAFNKYLREMLVDGGVISSETAKLWETMYPHYVPIRRKGDTGLNINVPLDTGRTGVNAPIKRATGGNRDILPLFDTMAQRTIQTYKAIAKNRFGVELKNTLGTTIANEALGIDEAIDSIDTQDGLLQEGKNGQKPTFTVFENGEKVTFEITEEMYDAMKPTNDILSGTSKTLNTISNIRRGTLTEYNPWFMLKNAVKDVQDVLVNSQHATRTYLSIPKAIKQMATNGQWYQEYVENGGDQNTYFDNDTNTFKAENKALETAKKVFGLNAISKANNIIERLPRLAEYIASREAGRSVDVSMLDAARVTTNFAAGGDLTRFLNRNGVTFLNASVQGALQQARNIREAKANGLKGWASLAGKYVAAGLPAVLLNHLIWDEDEEYEELSDYVKENYYIVGKFGDGKFVRIPKGRTVAVIQNAFQQMDNLRTGDDEVDLKSFLDLVVTNLAPNNPLDNNILSPIVDVATNEAWYGGDLVPTRLQDLPAAEQYDESTDVISKWLGETLNVSPYKVNYLLDQYSGVVGDTFLPMLTPEAESGDNSVLGNMIAPLKDMFSTDSVMNNQNVTDFYDLKDELMVTANGSNATDEDILRSKYINSISSELGELYAYKREIQNSKYSDSMKYELVRKAQQQIVDLMKEGMSNYQNISYEDDYREGGEYARIGEKVYKLSDKGEWSKLSDEQQAKYECTKAAGDSSYATDGKNHYRWYVPGEDASEDAKPAWKKISDDELEKQREVTKGLGISPEDYWGNKTEYDYAYKNPGKYAISRAVSDFETYQGYKDKINDIAKNNDSSTGTKDKDLVTDYIFSLDLDYGQRIILYRSLYDSKTDKANYNYDIVDYLNGRDDISYEEMVTILEELDMEVDSDGNVTW